MRNKIRKVLCILSACALVVFVALHVHLMNRRTDTLTQSSSPHSLTSSHRSFIQTNKGHGRFSKLTTQPAAHRGRNRLPKHANGNSKNRVTGGKFDNETLAGSESRRNLITTWNNTNSSNVSKLDPVLITRSNMSADSSKPSRVKYLIYLCDRGWSCGGWGDRQRGMASAFLLANVTHRRFGINMTLPCDVINYYVPNDVNWNISESEIKGKSYRVINNVGHNAFHDSLLKIDFEKTYPEDVIFLRTNVEHFWAIRSNPNFKTTLPQWAKHGRPKFFRDAWNMLIKPTEHLTDHLERVLLDAHFYNKTSPFVCAHVRIGCSKSNPEDSVVRNDVNQLGPLWEFLSAYVRNGSHVFLATDSSEVREMSREKFGHAHHDTGGAIFHIDKQRQRKDACEGFDQLVLKRCEVLVTSNSMFSSRAALIRGTNSGLYHYDKGRMRKVNLG
ncbi:hypothetical protein BaRGS_00026638 [Batillaria attramentaria]|uniref:Uncharacterized protein n=1 Tax=Batillaria attramentaria TaxID=370345 RepID=A0ABD0K5P4_9CAEN